MASNNHRIASLSPSKPKGEQAGTVPLALGRDVPEPNAHHEAQLVAPAPLACTYNIMTILRTLPAPAVGEFALIPSQLAAMQAGYSPQPLPPASPVCAAPNSRSGPQPLSVQFAEVSAVTAA